MSDVKVKELKINICKLTPDQIKKETSDDTFDNDNDKNNVSSLEYEFKLFWDAVNNKTDSDDIFTLDYLPFITLQKRTNPSNEMFVVALLSEIIRYLAPNHSEFRSKISYAAFLLQLIVGDSESYSVIDIFHKVELFVLNQNLAWSDDKVREQYLNELTDLTRSKRSPINNDENIFETEHKNDISAMDSDCDDDKDNVFLNIDTQVTISHDAENLSNITQIGVNENNIKLEDETELEDDEMYSLDQDLDPDNQTEFDYEENDEMKNDIQKPKKKWPKKKPIATPCPLCDVVLAFRHQLNRHIKAVHHKIKEFRCNFCKYETYRKCNLKQHIKGVHSYVNIDEIEFIRINQKKTKEDLNHLNSEATVQNDDLEEKIDDDFNDSEFINNSLEVTLEDFSDVQVKLNESAYITPFDNVPNEENLSSHDSNMHFMLEKSKETQPQITSSENSQLDGDNNALVENGAKAQNLTKQDNNGKVKKKRIRIIKKEASPCPHCSKVLAYKHLLRRHIKSIHEKVLDHHCKFCDYKTYQYSNLKQHIKNNHPDEDFVPIIGRSYTKPKNNDVQSKEEPMKCNDNPKDSTLVNKVKKINPSNFNPLYKCPHDGCDFAESKLSKRERHAIEVHQDYKLCTECGHVSRTYSDYKNHSSIHELIPCKTCGHSFFGKRALKQHIRNAHPEEDEKLRKPQKEVRERVSCEECGVQMHKYNLQSHVENVHGNEEIHCDLCDFVAKSKQKLKWHKSTHFCEMKECPNCGLMTKKLRAHFRRCSKKLLGTEEKHQCNYCNKEFKTKYSLEKHINFVHLKIKDHHCKFCDYKTHTAFNLRLHISKMHIKEDLSKECPHCHKVTMRLESHIKIYHFEHYREFMERKMEDSTDC